MSSVSACHGAGIAVHMLTGDHPQTARAIAAEVGIIPSQERSIDNNVVMVASKLDSMSDDDIDGLSELPLVVARCSPATKVRMIEALHRRKRYIAMTGDGVNDSLSLKRSDIGIAMGLGSDVAKESSDIVLTDDNFVSILNAVENGRRIFDNNYTKVHTPCSCSQPRFRYCASHWPCVQGCNRDFDFPTEPCTDHLDAYGDWVVLRNWTRI
jgi:magnesium-transporting ATPase (P-type)